MHSYSTEVATTSDASKYTCMQDNPTFEKLGAFQKTSDSGFLCAPYICCNEQDQHQTLLSIRKHSHAISGKKLHIGFSLWFNLDVVAETRPNVGIILDISPKVFSVYDILKTALLNSASPEMFINEFFKLLVEDERDLLQFPQDLQEQKLKTELTKGYGFLASQENFEYVKSLCAAERIFFGIADMTNADHIKLLADWCSEYQLSVTTLYLSNIPEWIYDNSSQVQMDSLKKNIALLINNDTAVIDAFYPTLTKCDFGPPQRIAIGELPIYQKLKYSSRITSPSELSSVRRTLFPDVTSKDAAIFSKPAAIKDFSLFKVGGEAGKRLAPQVNSEIQLAGQDDSELIKKIRLKPLTKKISLKPAGLSRPVG